MGEDSSAASNFFFHSCGGDNYIHLNFISMTNHFSQNHHHHHHRPVSSSRHSVLTFAVAAMVNFLEIKYQGKNESPFETRPKIMFFAVTSLLLYCLAYDAKSRFSSSYVNVCICRGLMAFFGPLSLAALFSILLPQSLCPVLFFLSILFSLFELRFSQVVKLWKWMRESIRVAILPTQQLQPGGSGRLIAVYPLMRLLQNVLAGEEDDIYNLPV